MTARSLPSPTTRRSPHHSPHVPLAAGLGGPGLDAPTHICSLILADVSPDGSSAGQVPRLSCQGPAGEGRLQVAGGALWTQPGAADGGVVVSPLGRSETDSARLAFTCGGSVTHLRLQHSVLSGIQLSAKGPLLQLLNCSRVSFDNVTLSGLGAPGQGVKYGAVQVSGAAVVSLAHFSCSNVTGFTVWGCLLLEVAAVADAQPAVYITDSSFTDVSTVGSASSTCKVFGAVVLDAAASTQQLPAAGLGVSMRRSIFERNAGGCGGALAVKCNLVSGSPLCCAAAAASSNSARPPWRRMALSTHTTLTASAAAVGRYVESLMTQA